MDVLQSYSTEQLAGEVVNNNAAIKRLAEINELIIQELIQRSDTNKPVQQELF